MVEVVAFWLRRDYPLSFDYIVTHVGWLLVLGTVLGVASATLGREGPLARTWFVLPVFIVLIPLVARRFGIGAVILGALLLAGVSARRGRHRESVIAASLGGAVFAVHLGDFLLWDYAGRATAVGPLLWLAATGGLVLVAYAGWVRVRSSALVVTPARAIAVVVGAGTVTLIATGQSGEPLPTVVTPSPSVGDRPPIVLIVLDTVRADHLRLYGYERETMPSLTAFGENEAVVVERAISNGPDSLDGHASLFTGLFPSNHGAHRPLLSDPAPPPFGYPLRPDVPTVAEVLREAGFATMAVSANYGPVGAESGFGLDRGFDVYRSFPNGDCDIGPASPWNPLARMVNQWGATWLAPCRVPYRRADLITDEAMALIDAAGSGGFFLFVNYLDAHRPYDPPAAFRGAFPGVDPRFGLDAMGSPEVGRLLAGEADLPTGLADHFRALYDGELLFLDTHLARLLERLRRHPRWDDMLLVITSDHGEALGEHSFVGHSAHLYDVITRVPFLVRPGHAAPDGVMPSLGHRWDHPMQLVDVAPLVLTHAGVREIPAVDGRLPTSNTVALYAWSFPSPPLMLLDDRFARELRSVEIDGWKLIEDSRGWFELYDLRTDPGEETDLSDQEPDRLERLRALLGPRVVYRDQVVPAGDRPSDESLERLRSLGYIR